MRPTLADTSLKSAVGGHTNFPVVPIEEVPAPELSGHGGAERPMVLVVDEQASIADAVAEMLNRNGYAAIAAYDGEEALETALLMPPELVITDAVLAGMSGIDMAAVLQKKLPATRVLLLSGTAVATGLSAPEGGAANGFKVLDKPIQQDQLLAQVSASLKA